VQGQSVLPHPFAQPDEPSAQPDEPPPKPEEPWYNTLARAVALHLEPEERLPLSELLGMALTGHPPVDFIRMVRAVGQRMGEKFAEQRLQLPGWLLAVAQWDFDKRFVYLYHFLLTTRLSRWRLHLHYLRRVNLSQNLRAFLEPAWEYYRFDGLPDGTPSPQQLYPHDPDRARRGTRCKVYCS
jgi:hypothetical protein